MARRNLFNSDLSEVSAVEAAPIRGAGSIPPLMTTPSSGIGEALGILAKWDASRAPAREAEKVAEVEASVDEAIDVSFNEAMGDLASRDIDLAVDQLSAMREAARQGKDRSDRFNITLMQQAKELKAKYPDRAQLINSAFKERGFIDPRASLLNEQQAVETARLQNEEARQEKMLNAAVEANIAVFNEPGNPGSGVNRTATFAALNEARQNQERTAETMKQLGLVRKEDGTLGYTIRMEYAQARPQLERDIWNQAVIGLRGPVNELQRMLQAANPQNLQEIRQMTGSLMSMADQFRNRILNEVNMSLNPVEREQHMKFVDESVLQPLLQIATNIRDAKDINQMKAAAEVLDFSSKNFQLMNHQDAPGLTRLSLLGREIASSFMNNVKLSPNMLSSGNRMAGKELSAVLDMLPDSAEPKSGQMDLDKSETEFGQDERAHRIGVSTNIQQQFVQKGLIASSDPDTYTWIASQKPLYNASKERLLSGNDVKQLTQQMLTNNYRANLDNAVKRFPEEGAKIGSYSFDVVERRLMDLSRELRTSGAGGQIGKDFAFEYNRSANRFEIKSLNPKKDNVQSAIEGIAAGVPGGMGVTQFSQDYSKVRILQERLTEINNMLPHLAKTKQFKPEYEGVSDDEFLGGLDALLNGRI